LRTTSAIDRAWKRLWVCQRLTSQFGFLSTSCTRTSYLQWVVENPQGYIEHGFLLCG
jgi:hypothetical protein